MKKFICCKCKQEKEILEFNKNSKKLNGINSICKKCHSEYRKEHYLQNKQKVLEQVIKYKKENPEKYIYKKNT